MRIDGAALVSRLEQEIQRYYPDWCLQELQVVGEGLEALVCRAETASFGKVAIQVPWNRFEANENDTFVDYRALLQQEAVLARHLQPLGLPVPTIYALHVEGETDFLVSSYIENDGSPVPGRQLGEVLARIHKSPVPMIDPCGQGAPLPAILAERIGRRLRVVEQYTGLRLTLPDGWAKQLEWQGARQSILHMDFRPANLLSNEGRLRAVVDWSNLLIGDPTLELARIAEYGHLDQAFLEGYGMPDPFGDLPSGLGDLYRLDTAVMLAVVFLSDAPNPRSARTQIERVQALCTSFRNDRDSGTVFTCPKCPTSL